jgi:hypothetical protein
VGAWYVNDRATLVGLVSDANADRTGSGDIGEGDFFILPLSIGPCPEDMAQAKSSYKPTADAQNPFTSGS